MRRRLVLAIVMALGLLAVVIGTGRDGNGGDLEVTDITELAVQPDCPAVEQAARLLRDRNVTVTQGWPAVFWPEDYPGNPEVRIACTFEPSAPEPGAYKASVYVTVTEFSDAEGLIKAWEKSKDNSEDCDDDDGCDLDEGRKDLEVNQRGDDFHENGDRTVQYSTDIQHQEVQLRESTYRPVGASYIVDLRVGLFYCTVHLDADPDGDMPRDEVYVRLEGIAYAACPVLS